MAQKGAVVARIISQYSDKGTKAAQKDLQNTSKTFDFFANKAKIAFAAAGAATLAFSKVSIAAYMEDQKSQKMLLQTLQNLGQGYADVRVEDFIHKIEAQTGVLDEQLRPAFAGLVRQTHDYSKAQDLLKLALDISAGSGKDLEQVTASLAKAYGGQTQAIGRLNIGLTKTDLAGKSFSEIQAKLTAMFQGQAATAADTYAGKVKILGAAYDNMKETIGKGLIDAFTNLSSGHSITDVTTQMQNFADSIAETTTNIGYLLGKIGSIPGGGIAKRILGDVGKANLFSEINMVANWLRNRKQGVDDYYEASNTAITIHTRSAGKVALDNIKAQQAAAKALADAQAKAAAKALADAQKKAKATAAEIASEKALLALKQFGISVASTTDPIELEAARLNLVKQNNIEAQNQFDKMMANIRAFNDASVAAGRYSDILAVLSDQTISTSEIELLAKKWGIPTDSVVAYIAKATGASNIPGLDSPGAIAAEGWKTALKALNDYLSALRNMPTGGGGGGAGAVGGNGASSSITNPLATTNLTPATQAKINASVLSPELYAGIQNSSSVSNFGALVNGGYANNTNAFGADRAGGQGIVVNMTVQGSVVTQNDLASAMRDSLLNGVLSGKPTTFSSVTL